MFYSVSWSHKEPPNFRVLTKGQSFFVGMFLSDLAEKILNCSGHLILGGYVFYEGKSINLLTSPTIPGSKGKITSWP